MVATTRAAGRRQDYQDVDKQKKAEQKKDYKGHEGSGILACFVFLSASGLELDATSQFKAMRQTMEARIPEPSCPS